MIRVVGHFSLACNGKELGVPPAAQRPVAFLATATRPVSRMTMAGRIWPDNHMSEAHDKLRKAMWRLNTLTPEPVLVGAGTIQFANNLRSDLSEARQAAAHLFDNTTSQQGVPRANLFEEDILIDWDDEWIEEERRGYHVLRLHALEHLARQSLAEQKLIDAERTCSTIVRDDPLRESARLLLATIHLALGDPARAMRGLNDYQAMLEADLGLLSSHRLSAAMEAVGLVNTHSDDTRGSRHGGQLPGILG